MMDCVILYRMKDGRVCIVRDADDLNDIAIFPHLDAAIAHCDETPILRKVDYQIVELDEL